MLLAAGSRGQASVRYVTITDGVVVAVLPHHDSIQEGTHVGAPGRAATTKAAQAAAALALLADLMPPLADEDQVTAPGRNPLIELNERAQVGAITDLGFTVMATGPPHDPVFTCSAACRHADGEISGTGQGRTKAAARAAAAEAVLTELAGPAEPAPSSHVRAVSRYAASPVGVADRLIQAGCATGYAKDSSSGASRRLAAARGTAGSPGAGGAAAAGTGTRPESGRPPERPALGAPGHGRPGCGGPV